MAKHGSGFLLTGLCIGLAVDWPEIVVVWLYFGADRQRRRDDRPPGRLSGRTRWRVRCNRRGGSIWASPSRSALGLYAAVQTLNGGSVRNRTVFVIHARQSRNYCGRSTSLSCSRWSARASCICCPMGSPSPRSWRSASPPPRRCRCFRRQSGYSGHKDQATQAPCLWRRTPRYNRT